MKKTFVGIRLKRLRDELQLTQAALAHKLGISLSYLNQIENNQRPLTVPVLLKLNETYGIDVQLFSDADEVRLIGELQQVFAERSLSSNSEDKLGKAEIKAIATTMPAVGRAIIAMHRQLGQTMEQVAGLSAKLGDDRAAQMPLLMPTPYEEVREYFYSKRNYIAELDQRAEQLSLELGHPVGKMRPALIQYLLENHSIPVTELKLAGKTDFLRHFDAQAGILYLSPKLNETQQAFQIATQLALLEHGDLLDQLISNVNFSGPQARNLTRIGLANYFAGALLMPYGLFLSAAEQYGYDIEYLGQHFNVSFETICHRLSTLQRPDSRGIPFFFIRVDRAGNISKRQSATDFHFSRFGGTCPLWNIYAAFAAPDQILTQLAQMPDGRTYFWIAKMIRHSQTGYTSPAKNFAVALGCDLHHAPQLVYSKGMILDNPDIYTPIGAGCKVCERQQCPQRAVPSLNNLMKKTITINEDTARFSPYASG